MVLYLTGVPNEEIQSLSEGSRRSQPILKISYYNVMLYQISRELVEAGYTKSATQCKSDYYHNDIHHISMDIIY